MIWGACPRPIIGNWECVRFPFAARRLLFRKVSNPLDSRGTRTGRAPRARCHRGVCVLRGTGQRGAARERFDSRTFSQKPTAWPSPVHKRK